MYFPIHKNSIFWGLHSGLQGEQVKLFIGMQALVNGNLESFVNMAALNVIRISSIAV